MGRAPRMTTGQRSYGCLGKARPQKYDLYIVSSGLGKTDDHCSGSGRLRRHTDGSPSSPHTTQRRMAGSSATYHSCPYSTTAVPHSFLPPQLDTLLQGRTRSFLPPQMFPLLPSTTGMGTPLFHHVGLHSFLPLQLSPLLASTTPVATKVEKILHNRQYNFEYSFTHNLITTTNTEDWGDRKGPMV